MEFTVLLSVYRKEKVSRLNECLTSITYKQTLKPTEIILVKDGLLGSALEKEIIYWQERLGNILKVYGYVENRGLAYALNYGLEKCDYDLVARMDTDDVADCERFEKQVGYMKSHPHVSVCSGLIEEWDENLEKKFHGRTLPLEHNEISKFAKYRSPISHPAAMFRKKHVLDVGGYPNTYPEDYALWIIMLTKGYKFGNLPDLLVKMRTGDEFYSRRGWRFFKGELNVILIKRKAGFISNKKMIFLVFIKLVLRLSPASLKKISYRYFRKS